MKTGASTTVVLAGGTGRRMGEDKRLLRLFPASPTFLERAVAVGWAVSQRVLVVGGPDVAGGERLPDLWPGLGPLGGLLTAVEHLGGTQVVVLACDYPLLQVDLVRRLMTDSSRAEASVAVDGAGRRHPLVGVYAASAVRPLARRLIEEGERSMAALLDVMDVRWMPATVDADHLSLMNVNAPADLAAARRAARERDVIGR